MIAIIEFNKFINKFRRIVTSQNLTKCMQAFWVMSEEEARTTAMIGKYFNRGFTK